MYWNAFIWREPFVSLSVSLHTAERVVDAAFSVLETQLSDCFQTVSTHIKIRLTKYEDSYLFELTSITFVHILYGSLLTHMT